MWRVCGASVQGTSHLEKDIPCQDAHAWRLALSGALLLAIADGAGSAEHSQEGSRAAVEGVLDALEQSLADGPPGDEPGWQDLITRAFASARAAVEETASGGDAPLRAYATTLACAVISAGWLVVGQIGDGAVVAEDEQGSLLLSARPMRGEYANEAYFLTMPGALDYLAVYSACLSVRGLALTTDGLLRLAFKLPGYEPSPPFFAPLLAFARAREDPKQAEVELAAFLRSARVSARTEDDKTLLLAVWIDAPALAEEVEVPAE